MAVSPLAIEARWLRVDGHPQAHWLLCDANQQVLAEFHCLARHGAGWRAPSTPVPPASLRLVHLVHPGADFDATVPAMPAPARRDYESSEIVLRSDDEMLDALARWMRAASALPLLNRALEDSGDDALVDSQSALATLARWMGLATPPPWPGRPQSAAATLPPIRGLGETLPYPALDGTGNDAEPAAVNAQAAGPLAHDPLREHPLYRQARNAVARMEDDLGRGYDATSETLTRSLVELAEAHGLAGIDHVVLSRRSGRTRAGENVFVVRGGLDDPAHQRVVMRTDDALDREA